MIDNLLSGIQHFRTFFAIGIPMLGGALVVASSILMPRGKAKGLLSGAYMFLAAFGVACLLFAAAACMHGASLGQTGPLWVIGLVLAVIMGIFTPATIREYQQFEFRKLAAELFRRS
jgi:hypothetical protein